MPRLRPCALGLPDPRRRPGRVPESATVGVDHLRPRHGRLGYSTETFGFEPFSRRYEILFLRVLVAWATGNMATLAQADVPRIQRTLAEFTGCMSGRRFENVNYKELDTFHTHFLGDFARFLSLADADKATPIINLADADALVILRRFLSGLRDLETCELPRLAQSSGLLQLASRAFVFDEQVDEAVASILDFARSAAEFETFDSWLSQMASRDADIRVRQAKGRQVLRLYSIPAAKGLEFEQVVIPDASANSFDSAEQEERNLFYVAASRARSKLTMTFTSRPSSFLSVFGRHQDWGQLN